MRLAYSLLTHPLTSFAPRPDNAELLDQQASFYADRFPGIACVLAGNGAGKSFAGAAKVAAFLEHTPPPERHTPFWILSQTMDVVSGNCWGQNLRLFIPPERIESIAWYREASGKPRTVVLKPHANGGNYVLEFKSYDQGRQALQAANIVGFWLDEQCPMDLLNEVLARTRKWAYPGSKVYTLTPMMPDIDLEDRYNFPEDFPGWRFYRLNTRCNLTLDPEYVRRIEENETPALVETRLTGAFSVYEGLIFPSFLAHGHIIEPFEIDPRWLRVRGLDTGFEHPTACLWAAIDPATGRYYIYREYAKARRDMQDHIAAINGPTEGHNPEAWKDVRLHGATYADPANKQILNEFALLGLSTVPAQKDVEASFATIRSLLRPTDGDGQPLLKIFSTCPMLIQQLRTYVYDPVTRRPVKETDKRAFDLVDCLRYLTLNHQLGTVKPKPYTAPARKVSPV
jgi:phage terminase large subunit-like protein